MTDLLTTEDDRAARQQGWFLSYVYDLHRSRWTIAVMASPNGPFKSAHVAAKLVVEKARGGDALALRALQLVLRGPAPTPRRKK